MLLLQFLLLQISIFPRIDTAINLMSVVTCDRETTGRKSKLSGMHVCPTLKENQSEHASWPKTLKLWIPSPDSMWTIVICCFKPSSLGPSPGDAVVLKVLRCRADILRTRRGPATMAHSWPVKSRKKANRDLPALFVTSLTQTGGHKMAVFTVVFSPRFKRRFLTSRSRNWVKRSTLLAVCNFFLPFVPI